MGNIKFLLILFLVSIFILPLCDVSAQEESDELLNWSVLAELPETEGFGGAFAGVHNDALIIAGGTNFPEEKLWEGGKKQWYAGIYVLERTGDDLKWHTGFDLKRPVAYGACVDTEFGLLCMGGCGEVDFIDEVFLLNWDSEKKSISIKEMPRLPKPCAYSTAAMVDGVVYLAGGKFSLTGQPEKNFWKLDLSAGIDNENSKWKVLPSWPGAGRVTALSAGQNDGFGKHFYLFGGRDVDEQGESVFLSDSYRYSPSVGQWVQIEELPRPVRSSTCIDVGQNHIMIFGGPDGSLVGKGLNADHPGFPTDILMYHTITDTWVTGGHIPVTPAVTHAVKWDGGIVIPTGEIRTATRTPKIYKADVIKTYAGFGAINYLVLISYLMILVYMGFYFSKREKTTEDFFLGGRRIPWWAAGISIFGTQLSAISFMAIPAKCFATNQTIYWPSKFVILMSAPIVCYAFIPFFRRLNVTTAYEYLEVRFNLATRLFASLLFIMLQLGRMGIVVFLPAIVLSAVTGINIQFCIIAMGVLCIIYTVMGGIEAVIWTDVLQVGVLMGGAVIALVVIIASVDGGFGEMYSIGMADAKFTMAYMDKPFDLTSASLLVILFAWGGSLSPYISDQSVIQRYLTTKDEKQARQAMWTSAFLVIPSSIFFILGACLYAYYKSNPNLLKPEMGNDAIFPHFIINQIPPGVSGLVIAGIFAAAMSSLDSSMNSASTALVTDFYRRFKTTVDEHHCLKLARWLTVVLGVFGTAIALIMSGIEIKSVFDQFNKILGLFGGGLAGVFLLGAFSKRANGRGVLVGLIVTSILIWYIQSYTEIHYFLYATIGIFSCCIVGLVASLIIPGKTKNIEGLTVYSILKKKDDRP